MPNPYQYLLGAPTTDTPDRAGMNTDELRILAEASKLLARTEYRKDAARLNAIIIMEGGDDPLIMCRPDVTRVIGKEE